MTNETKHTPEAEALADAILKAAGSGLRHYMPSSKARIIEACQTGIDGSRKELLEALEMVRDADEDCHKDGLPTIPAMPRAKIDAAIAKVLGKEGGVAA